MTANNTDKMFGTLQAKYIASFEDLCRYKQKQIHNILAKKNRHKYWYCICTACKKIHVIRSDYLNRKVCRCQHRKSE